jgi:hypothetical protein
MLITKREPNIRDKMAARPLCCLSPMFDIISVHLLSDLERPVVKSVSIHHGFIILKLQNICHLSGVATA